MSELFQMPAYLIDGPCPPEDPYIENVSLSDILTGHHSKAHVLIQIVDHDMKHPTPAYLNFEESYRFSFLDIEEKDHPFAPTAEHASDIVAVLKDALLRKKSVVVHCVAGVCRSGAVAEVGVMLGFQDTEKYRQPNLLLKKLLVEAAFPGSSYED